MFIKIVLGFVRDMLGPKIYILLFAMEIESLIRTVPSFSLLSEQSLRGQFIDSVYDFLDLIYQSNIVVFLASLILVDSLID